ncbi:unnamed protein product [Gulo gulo]|uniref:Uncharacterized protein n=1 Tax=Gulo gulo TaxID=48420 RepID=A0A9X9Q5I4_GULGU|nr:unnamed protein product [Gulo gulo]
MLNLITDQAPSDQHFGFLTGQHIVYLSTKSSFNSPSPGWLVSIKGTR